MGKSFANREVADLMFVEYSTKKPFMNFELANTTGYDLEGDTVFAYGGQGHPKRVSFSGNRSGTFRVETQMQTMKLYQMITGADLKADAQFLQREVVKAGGASNKELTIQKTPIDGSVHVYKASDDCGTEVKATTAATKVTLETAGAAGDEYIVYYLTNLIQTNEMPNSYVLYQEQEMQALHYAGIPMSECYTAIKNIAKKRKEKVLAYKDVFKKGFAKAIVEDEGKSEEEADELTNKLWQIIEDSASYSFNCVAGNTRIRLVGVDHESGKWIPTVDALYKMQQSGRLHYGRALSMFEDGSIRPNLIKQIVPSGTQMTYLVCTNTGFKVECTMEHKFPTPRGELPLYKLHWDDEVYVDYGGGYASVDRIAIIEPAGETTTYDIEMADPAHNFVTESGLIVSNCSHSYCVALDSLYEAWLKANHPLEFYEVALNLYEQKGDKDKVAALKEEAEKYFDILFPPMRYGQDNRQMRADLKTNSIVNSLGSIKGMSKAMGAKLYECAQQDHQSFFDVLKWLDERSIKSAKVIPLVKIDYFNSFGNNVELLRLITWWDFFKQGTAKTISKDKLSPAFEEMLSLYASDKSVKGEPLKSYKINDMNGLLKAIEEYVFSLHLEELPYRVKAANQNEILGYVDMTTQKEEDRRKLYLLDVRPLIGKWNAGKPWKYIFHCKSVGSGKVSQLSVTPYRYNNTITKALKGDIILAKHVHKNEKGYWELDDYEILPG